MWDGMDAGTGISNVCDEYGEEYFPGRKSAV